MPRPKTQALICSVEGCEKSTKSKGFCKNHYANFWRNGNPISSVTGEKRNHPLYVIWWGRKSENLLCEAWLDFDTFVKDVTPKPEGYYFLVLVKEGLFGPDNFRWQEHLKRKEGESKKDWWARKRVARIAASPGMESDRNIKRRFGLTREQYDEKLKNQNFACAICGEKESGVDPRNGTLKRLAVDHNHTTGKIRDLLCWRCNGTLGKIGEDLDLLKKIEAYLVKHL